MCSMAESCVELLERIAVAPCCRADLYLDIAKGAPDIFKLLDLDRVALLASQQLHTA